MTYGSWGILEPDPRDSAPTRGAQGLLADPAWLLSRQWSFSELDGFDGGAPATSLVRYALVPLDRINVDGWALTPPGGVHGPAPLAEPSALTSSTANWSDAVEELEASLSTDPTLPARLREAMGAVAQDDDAPPALRMAARRGRLSAGTLARLVDSENIAGTFTLNRLSELLRAALSRSVPALDPFSTETMDHRGSWVAFPEGAGSEAMGEGRLISTEDRPGWWALDDVRVPEPSVWSEAAPIPARMTFPGAPPARHWSITETATDWLVVDAGPSELPVMIAALALSQVAPDTLVLPLTVARGGALRLDSVEVSDAFGHITRHLPAKAGPDLWATFVDTARPGFLCDFAARAPLEGEPIESVAIVPENTTNVVWLIERRVPGPRGNGRLIIESVAPDMPLAADDPPMLELLHPPPPNWLPLRPDADSPVLLPGPLIGGITPTKLEGRIGKAVKRIRRDAMPAEGLGIDRRWRLGRDPQGRAVAWITRHCGPHEERSASGLAFDRLILPSDHP